jgi:hypothetical protein
MIHLLFTGLLYVIFLGYFIGAAFAYFLEELVYDMQRHFPSCASVDTTPRLGGSTMWGCVLRSFGSWYDVRIIQDMTFQVPAS